MAQTSRNSGAKNEPRAQKLAGGVVYLGGGPVSAPCVEPAHGGRGLMDECGQRGFERAGLEVDVDCSPCVHALEHVTGMGFGASCAEDDLNALLSNLKSVWPPGMKTMWMSGS